MAAPAKLAERGPAAAPAVSPAAPEVPAPPAPAPGLHVGVNALFLIPREVGGTETYLLQTLAAMLAEDDAVRFTLFTNRENDALLRALFPQERVRHCALGVAATKRA